MPFDPVRLYRGLRFGRPIVVVSGLPRSGTSMAMKMLEAGGVEVIDDGHRAADVDNPKGYFEYERIKNLAAETDKGWLCTFRGKAVKIISYLLRELPPTNNYRVLFMRRDLHEIVASQSKMLEHRQEGSETADARMIELFENHLWRVNYLIKHSRHLETQPVHYRQVLDRPREAAARMRDFLDLDLDLEAMAAAVDPTLYRNRAVE